MPLRTFLVLLGLFTLCVILVVISWAIGAQLYIFLPSRHYRQAYAPPTHPAVILLLLGACITLFLYSQRYALIYFSSLVGFMLLGTLVGWGVFQWKPSVMQLVLILAMIAEMSYGWIIRDNYLSE